MGTHKMYQKQIKFKQHCMKIEKKNVILNQENEPPQPTSNKKVS